MSDSSTPEQASPAVVYEARELVKQYGEGQLPALRGVNLRIEKGEFVAIIGQSGCGKTSLLNMLGALDHPSSGSLLYRGEDLQHLDDLALYRAKEIGFIFQSFHLLPTFTLEENVQIPMFGLPWTKKERRDRAVDLLDAVGLSHRRDHLPSKLSGGERQRAAIARSLVNDPTVLLADEPTGNLDSKNAEHVMELIDRVHVDHDMTLVMVTHDLEVASHGNRVIRMKDGEIVSDGRADAPAGSTPAPATASSESASES